MYEHINSNLEINNITLPLEGLSEFPNLDKM